MKLKRRLERMERAMNHGHLCNREGRYNRLSGALCVQRYHGRARPDSIRFEAGETVVTAQTIISFHI
jgi:hypothetical protein